MVRGIEAASGASLNLIRSSSGGEVGVSVAVHVGFKRSSSIHLSATTHSGGISVSLAMSVYTARAWDVGAKGKKLLKSKRKIILKKTSGHH